MPIDSPFSVLVLAIPPIVALVFVFLLWRKQEQHSQPSIVAAIPFCLISISLLLTRSSFVILAAFSEIAAQRRAGLAAVLSGLLDAQRPIALAFLDVAACLTLTVLVSGAIRFSRDEDGPLISADVSLPALIATGVFLASLFLIAYIQYSTVDLVMMVVDTHRNHELSSIYRDLGMGDLARKISARLVMIWALSVFELLALVVTGIFDLVWRKRSEPRPMFGILLMLGALAGCGLCALDEFSFVSYLVRMH